MGYKNAYFIPHHRCGLYCDFQIYFAFIPISTRFGQIVSYAYCIIGIGLIVALCGSLRWSRRPKVRRKLTTVLR